jgi:drug/metabolite transporter (DMT)-like permease
MVAGAGPPITLNFLRWVLAFAMLLPLAAWVLRPGSGLWSHWRRYALLGLLGVGCYNALQYLALKTSTPLNVTLVASSIAGVHAGHRRAVLRPARSPASRCWAPCCRWPWRAAWCCRAGSWAHLLQVRLVTGDLYVLLATACLGAVQLAADAPRRARRTSEANWAAFLMAQMVFGLGWSGAVCRRRMGADRCPHPVWGWPLAARCCIVAVGPAILAYRCWGLGVQRVGPSHRRVLFQPHAAVRRADVHRLAGRRCRACTTLLAFALIVGGIVVSSRR